MKNAPRSVSQRQSRQVANDVGELAKWEDREAETSRCGCARSRSWNAAKFSRHDPAGRSMAATRNAGEHEDGRLAEPVTPSEMLSSPSHGYAVPHVPLSDPAASLADLRNAFGRPEWSKLPNPSVFVGGVDNNVIRTDLEKLT